MTDRSDIMRGSNAWTRLTNGVERSIGSGDQPGGEDLRAYLHNLAPILTVIVANLDGAIDTAHRAHATADDLDKRVFDSEKGIVVKLRSEHRNENKWVLRAVVGGLISIIVTLIVIVITVKAGTS